MRVGFAVQTSYSVKKSQLLVCISILLGLIPNLAFARQQIYLEVEGIIKPHCAFEQNQEAAASVNPDVVFQVSPEDPNWANQSGKTKLALSCNAPFTLAARSLQGSLKHVSATTNGIGGNFSNEIAYQVAFNLTTEDAAAPLALTCQSSDLKSGGAECGISSGTNAAIGFGAGIGDLAVTLSGSSGFPIYGRYQDTIVLALAFQ